MDRDSSVGIATRYGLVGPGTNPGVGRDFPHLSRPALRPTRPPIQSISRGYSGWGVALTTRHLAPMLEKE